MSETIRRSINEAAVEDDDPTGDENVTDTTMIMCLADDDVGAFSPGERAAVACQFG